MPKVSPNSTLIAASLWIAVSSAAQIGDPSLSHDSLALTPLAQHILWEQGTERAYTGMYWNHFESGVYACIHCGRVLFDSASKFESHCGWPSFSAPAEENGITYHTDLSHGMRRVEVRCGRCKGHLGHVFEDGPLPTGQRFCINSAVLEFRGEGSHPKTP